ncbi:MAG: hypothetical protein ACFB4I_24200 [Cyanophyceae cyanobacterium]
MKQIQTTALTLVLTALAAVPAVQAQETRPSSRVAARNADNIAPQTTPFGLVTLARRGQFEDFPTQSHLRLADATDLVEAGIAQGRVSPEALNDSAYLNAVDLHLGTLSKGR